MKNIAEKIIENYQSEDFKEQYAFMLIEDAHHVFQAVKRLLTVNKWEMEEKIGASLPYCSNEQCQKVTNYILENSSDFITTFSGFYVGHYCLNSVEFGEQEEDLTTFGLPLKKAQKMFSKAGFYINGQYAYYNVGSGLMLDFSKIDKDTLLDLIK